LAGGAAKATASKGKLKPLNRTAVPAPDSGTGEVLRESGRAFEIVRDLVDMPDPRNYVSKANRCAEELARLRAEKSRH
jgi:hypothetical protein